MTIERDVLRLADDVVAMRLRHCIRHPWETTKEDLKQALWAIEDAIARKQSPSDGVSDG